MRALVLVSAALAAAATIVAAQAAEPVKSQSSEVVTTPLTGDASREVKVFNVLLPPGADSVVRFEDTSEGRALYPDGTASALRAASTWVTAPP